MSTKLAKPKVLEQIQKLPWRLRKLAHERLESATGRRRRHGSVEFARHHPSLAVTAEEKLEMDKLHKGGLSFRAIEETYGLIPNSGNDAQRCVRWSRKSVRQRKRRYSRVA